MNNQNSKEGPVSETNGQSIPEIGQTIRLGDLDVNYHDRGNGAPILLIHGSGPGVTAWANWRVTIPALESRARVIAPDMAGFGYTASDGEFSFSKDRWIAQIIGLLDVLEIDKAAIVGNSFGGSMALELVKRHPDRCGKIVLMGAVGISFPLTDGLDAVWGYTPSLDAMRHLLKVFVANESLVTEDLVEMRYRASMRPGVQERFARLFPTPRQRWVDALAQEARALERMTNEVLIVHGRQDKVIPFEASVRLSETLPNAALQPMDDCGHWVQIEKAEAFNACISDFLLGKV